MIVDDRRTDEQRRKLTILVVGTDRVLSGWGLCEGGTSVAAWACTSDDVAAVEAWVRSRGDMRRVRVVYDLPGRGYRPRRAAHFSIYPVEIGHPALPARTGAKPLSDSSEVGDYVETPGGGRGIFIGRHPVSGCPWIAYDGERQSEIIAVMTERLRETEEHLRKDKQ